MGRMAGLVVGLVGMLAVTFAGAPDEALVQGLYEGTWKTGQGEGAVEARVVAQGDGVYKVFVRQQLGEGKLAKVDLAGKTEGEKVTFAGKAGDVEWEAAYADGAVTGRIGQDGKLELKRVVKESPTLGKKPPEGAIVLLDGKSFDQVIKRKNKDGSEDPWNPAEDGSVQVAKGGMRSKYQPDGNFDYHVEFMVPFRPKAHSQGRGNSGVFLPNGDEIQVLDSFGDSTYTGGGCGGIYKYKDPDAFDVFSLASAPPLQWQTYDIEYRVEKKDGKLVGKPRVTVYHNGIKIHDNFELRRPAKPGGFSQQDHGNPVRYRNMWVLPVEGK